MASIAGLFIGDPATRERVAAVLAAQFPPLEPVLGKALDTALSAAPTVSVVGVVVLLWSASGIVRALDAALAQVYQSPASSRGPLRLVVLVLAAGLGSVAIAVVVIAATLTGPIGDLIGLGAGQRMLPLLALGTLVTVTYRFLPNPRPSWRAVILPGIATTIAISVLTGAFALVGPIVFGSVDLYGAFAVLFLGIVWLGFSTDLFMIGSAWAAVRAEDERALGAN